LLDATGEDLGIAAERDPQVSRAIKEPARHDGGVEVGQQRLDEGAGVVVAPQSREPDRPPGRQCPFQLFAGVYEGREAIREFFAGASSAVPFAIHHVTNPILEIDGDRATGRWYLWQPIVFAEGDQALWMAARYDDVYRREDGVWRFEHVTVKLRMLSPYEQGFAKARMIDVPL